MQAVDNACYVFKVQTQKLELQHLQTLFAYTGLGSTVYIQCQYTRIKHDI